MAMVVMVPRQTWVSLLCTYLGRASSSLSAISPHRAESEHDAVLPMAKVELGATAAGV